MNGLNVGGDVSRIPPLQGLLSNSSTTTLLHYYYNEATAFCSLNLPEYNAHGKARSSPFEQEPIRSVRKNASLRYGIPPSQIVASFWHTTENFLPIDGAKA